MSSPFIDYEKELNEAQYEAVFIDEGPAMVIAGAGSGKTRTLVYRVARLVETGIDPESILLLTFTRKAAAEMMDRASQLLDVRCRSVSGGTFHSIANYILRKYGDLIDYPNYSIIDRGDCGEVIGYIIGELGIKRKELKLPRNSTIIDIISKSINKSLEIADLLEIYYPHLSDLAPVIGELALRYEKYKKERKVMDYDDLLVNLKTLLIEFPGVRQFLSNKYRYIMVDEYQDTNRLQAEIVKLLGEDHRNVMVVGDDSQSIYSFRGADFRNIMDFPGIFPDAKIIKLEENFRSTQPILKLTNAIISRARQKYTKCLFTKRKGGVLPKLVIAWNESEQSEWITKKILSLTSEGINLKNIAVLFRSSFHSFDLEVQLAKHGIPFAKYGGLKFAEAAHIKDLLAHLRVFLNPHDHLSWNRILKLLPGIGQATANKVTNWLDSDIPSLDRFSEYVKTQKGTMKILNELVNLFDKLSDPSLEVKDLVEEVRKYYEPIMTNKFDDYPKRLRDLEYLQEWCAPFQSLEQFLTDMALEPPEVSRAPSDFAERPDFLTLSTIHSAKGLEWKVVFVIHAADGYFPSRHSLYREDDLEEERRLMYVACTRAKEQLFIVYPETGKDSYYGQVTLEMSQFIRGFEGEFADVVRARNELYGKSYPETVSSGYGLESLRTGRGFTIKAGDVLKHPDLGMGVVLEIMNHNKARVFFKKRGIRTIDLKSVKDGQWVV